MGRNPNDKVILNGIEEQSVSVKMTATVSNDDAGSSRRDFLAQGSRITAGVGVAALLGNLGNWALS